MPQKKPLRRPKKRAKRSCNKRLTIGGSLVEVISVAKYAELIGRQRLTVIRYEREGKFPPAPITYKGVRYYTESLAEKMKPILKKFPQHLKPPAELLTEINIAYSQEREHLLRCQNQ